MLIKRMVLAHLLEVCPDLQPILKPFVDNFHYETKYKVKATGEKLQGADSECKSGHLLSFPTTACSILICFLFCFLFQIIYLHAPGIPVGIWLLQPELII